VRLFADSNSWIVNRTPNLRTVRLVLRVVSQLAFGNVLAQPSVLFSVELLESNLKYQFFYFQVCGDMVEET